MSRSKSRTLTVEDLYRLPDDGRKYELVEGNLLSEPLPGARHGRVAARIVRLLSDFVEANALGEVLTCDTGFVLARSPDTVRGPDVAFVSRERYDAAGDPDTAFPGAPDLAVEVLSPANRPGELHAKIADYLSAGTRLVWVVDPQRETVTTYQRLLEPQRLHGEDLLDGGDVLTGFGLRLSDLF